MRLALTFLLLWALRLHAAVGDITGAWTSTNGGILYVNVTGVTTNGTWGSFGLVNNQWTGRERASVKLNVTGNGFGTAGEVITSRGRTLIGTSKFSGLYPATNAFETSADGTYATLQIAMSDFVFIGETITLDMTAGLYTESGNPNNAASGVTVTNESYINYTNARPVFNWLTPQFNRSTGSTYRVEALACHWSSIYDNSGRPVQAIEFRAADENSHSVTQIVTQPFFDYNQFGVGGARYVWNVPTGTFNDTNMITVNARTLVFFGTNAIIDTSDGVFTAPSPNYCPLKFLNDPNGTYGECYANVSTNTGSDATGVVTNLANWTTNVAPFYTIRGAANAMAIYNSNFFGRIDCGGGHIYLEAGGWRMGGTNLAAGVRPRTYVELLPYPGLTPQQCFLYTNHSTTDISDLIKVSGMELNGAAVGTAVIFDGVDCLWTDNCDWATGQSAALNAVTNWYVTGNRFFRMAQGVNTFASATGGPAFVRDSLFDFTNTTTTITPILFRTKKTNKVAAVFTVRSQSSAVRPRPSTILAYNSWLAVSNQGSTIIELKRDNIQSDYIGIALMANVVEDISASSATLLDFGGSGSTSNMFNLQFFGNTFTPKINWFYDDASVVWPRLYSPSWVIGNFCDDTNIKGDEFTPANGARYGNRPQMWNVGFSQNILPETYNIGTPGSFQQGGAVAFYGLNSYSTNSTTTNTMWQFTRRGSYTTAIGAGNGDYRYLSPSPAFKFIGPRVLSHKQDGPTSAIDPPGAYMAGQRLKGAMF